MSKPEPDRTVKTWQQKQQLDFTQRFARIVGARAPRYKSFHPKRIEDLPFQKELVDQCIAHPERIWSAELATGIGKTVIAARIASHYLQSGTVVYITPNATSIGDLEDGVVNKFYRGLKLEGKESAALGPKNDLSLAHDVCFVTPWFLAHALKVDRERVMRVLGKISCLIIDEAHRFPEDEQNKLIVYSQIHKVTQMIKARVAIFTGTWQRYDGQKIVGLKAPVTRIPVKQAIEMGRCPQLWGIQVITEIKKGKARVRGDLFDIHLSQKERKRYLEKVGGCVVKAYKMYSKPFAVFTRSIADAEFITNYFNKKSAIKMALLTAHTSQADRKTVIIGMQKGEILGYATCAVGEEAIDIPDLSVIHLVRRTKSVTRNMQAIGRALRVRPGKKAVVVDYQTLLPGLKKHFIGINLDDVGVAYGFEWWFNGGALGDKPDAKLKQLTMCKERELILEVENPAPAPKLKPRVDFDALRTTIRGRAEKVAGMVQARGQKVPGDWVEKVVGKLMEPYVHAA